MLVLLASAISIAGCARAEAPGGGGRESAFSVSLIPERPNARSEIKAVLNGEAARVEFTWLKNGEKIEGLTGDTLAKGEFKKGDVIKVSALADGRESSAEIKVANAAPSIRSVEIKPAKLVAGVDIMANVDAYDPDNDRLQYEYRWSINGAVSYETFLSGKSFKRGDSVSLKVVAYDGEDESAPFEAPVTAANSPPSFDTVPPAGFSKFFIYDIKASDPDGDTVSYALLKGPAGMEVRGNRIEWDAAGADGTVDVVVSADDGHGGSTQQSFNLTVSKTQREGSLTVKKEQ